jgi:hypothetical protein
LTLQTLDEAKRKRDELIERLAEGREPAETATVSMLLDRWMDVADLALSTRVAHEIYIERVIRPVLGDWPVRKLERRVDVLDQLYAHLRRCRRLCDGAAVHRAPHRRRRRRYGGCRSTSPRSKSCAHFRRREDICAKAGVPVRADGYLFTRDGFGEEPWLPDSMTQRFLRLRDHLGLHCRLHDLRHYNATQILASGIDLRTVAGRLGHSGGGSTTLKVYAHWTRPADQLAAHILSEGLPDGRDSA